MYTGSASVYPEKRKVVNSTGERELRRGRRENPRKAEVRLINWNSFFSGDHAVVGSTRVDG